MGNHQHPRRPAEFFTVGDCIKGGEPGFPQTRRHGNESLGIALSPDRGERGESFALPGAGRRQILPAIVCLKTHPGGRFVLCDR